MVHRGEGIRVTVQQIRTEHSNWDLRLSIGWRDYEGVSKVSCTPAARLIEMKEKHQSSNYLRV